MKLIFFLAAFIGLIPVSHAKDPAESKPEETVLHVSMVRLIRVPLRLTYEIKVVDGKKVLLSSNHLIEPGETFPGTDFQLIRFTPKEGVDSLGTAKDVSELEVKNLKTGRAQHLIQGAISDSPEIYALLKTPKAEFKVTVGQTFSLPSSKETVWRVTEISEAGVLLKQVGTEKLARVPKL